MTSFCVFGVSRQMIFNRLEKSMDIKSRESEPDFYARVRAAAGEKFSTSFRGTKVSPVFDAPQFCDDWMRIASKDDYSFLTIMCRSEKIDKKGDIVIKDGAPVLTWVKWQREPIAA